jgi:hypothetical protein
MFILRRVDAPGPHAETQAMELPGHDMGLAQMTTRGRWDGQVLAAISASKVWVSASGNKSALSITRQSWRLNATSFCAWAGQQSVRAPQPHHDV